MTLTRAVKKLGGASKVAALTGLARTSILYWMKRGAKAPSWRRAEIRAIIHLAEQAKAPARD